ncbi:helix-turn-helix transcriptional regulator [Paenibacillus taichungensis]|uniref:Helix-turn-helix transcriptional regulator n=1 Tax=Paenibacillus taichungensis TaxID=484184 RepID=A0ABX2MCL3_9BACL|nr:helix-turn-helix transcriptional regulator [Paenibacillus taichungensis]
MNHNLKSKNVSQFKSDLRTIRLIRGLSRKDVSINIGISDKTLYRYEKEPGTTPLHIAKRLSSYYGVPLDQFDYT